MLRAAMSLILKLTITAVTLAAVGTLKEVRRNSYLSTHHTWFALS
jgi:hypothetical protein